MFNMLSVLHRRPNRRSLQADLHSSSRKHTKCFKHYQHIDHSNHGINLSSHIHIHCREHKLFVSVFPREWWAPLFCTEVDKTKHHHLQGSQSYRLRLQALVPARLLLWENNPGVFVTLLTQAVDWGTDLESWTKLDVHGGDQVVLTQQQQSLSVNLLGEKLGGQLLAPLKWGDKPAHLLHTPLGRSCREEVVPLQREASRSRAVGLRGAVVGSRARVWRTRREGGSLVVFFTVAGSILRAAGLGVTLHR